MGQEEGERRHDSLVDEDLEGRTPLLFIDIPGASDDIVLLGLLLVLPIVGRYVGVDLNIFSTIVLEPARWLIQAILWMTGYF